MLKTAVISVLNNATLGLTFYGYKLSLVSLVPGSP